MFGSRPRDLACLAGTALLSVVSSESSLAQTTPAATPLAPVVVEAPKPRRVVQKQKPTRVAAPRAPRRAASPQPNPAPAAPAAVPGQGGPPAPTPSGTYAGIVT